MLDLGCGTGRHAFACLKAGARVVALDASLDELAPAVSMFEAMRDEGEVPADASAAALGADACRLPFRDGTFDCVIAAEVLEHVHDDRAALAELARVLRAGGTLALSVPRCGPEALNWALSRAYHSVEGGHVRIYRVTQLLARLRAAGFAPMARRHVHGLHSPYWWLRCFVGVERAEQRLVAAYHRLLVWHITASPRVTRLAEAALDPLIGKSLVLYCVQAADTSLAKGGPT